MEKAEAKLEEANKNLAALIIVPLKYVIPDRFICKPVTLAAGAREQNCKKTTRKLQTNNNAARAHVAMPAYYLDIETTGLIPSKSKIITIQYQELERNTGKPAGPLVILKEWELGGEAKILEKFIKDTYVTSKFPFDFIPVGNNLKFEHDFLSYKSKRHCLKLINIADGPLLDLQTTLVLMNHGEFKGSGLDKMTGKRQSGKKIEEWYMAKKYDKIESYITDEAEAVSKFFVWLCQKMPALHKNYMKIIK